MRTLGPMGRCFQSVDAVGLPYLSLRVCCFSLFCSGTRNGWWYSAKNSFNFVDSRIMADYKQWWSNILNMHKSGKLFFNVNLKVHIYIPIF